MSEREADAVNEWIKSGTSHVMRDHGLHCISMLAGELKLVKSDDLLSLKLFYKVCGALICYEVGRRLQKALLIYLMILVMEMQTMDWTKLSYLSIFGHWLTTIV